MSNLILSQDGSHTIESDRFGVTYHSKYGAIQETQTVFIDAGLNQKISDGYTTIHILEMGFGTGLNALMTLKNVIDRDITVHYHTIEAYPIDLATARELNYPTVLSLNDTEKAMFMQMHSCHSYETVELTERFSFTKHITTLQEFVTEDRFDVIYFDAFAPTSQEELWTEDIMKKLASFSNPDGLLVTYCAKGSFKRALKAAGFAVEGLPGPIGKREMTRGRLVI